VKIQFPPELGGEGGNKLSIEIAKLDALTPNPSPNFGRGEKNIEKILISSPQNWGVRGQ
jgi:hypothetical protein